MGDDTSLLHLGYIGRPLVGDEQLDISLSRLGGKPVWSRQPPAESPVNSEGYFVCQVCHGPLVMLGQFSAGYASAPRRLLHLFACTAASCGSDPRAWRALRSVDPPEPSSASSAKQASQPSGEAASTGAQPAAQAPAFGGDDWGVAGGSDDWGVAGGDDWGAGGGTDWGVVGGDDWGVADSAPGGGSAVASVDAEIEQLLQTRGARAAAPQGKQARKAAGAAQAAAQEAVEGATDDAWSGTHGASPAATWPCFALEIYDEPPAEAKSGEHEQELLQRYLQSEFANEELCNAEVADGLSPEMAEELSAERTRLKQEVQSEGPDEDELDMDVDDDDDECLGDRHEMQWLLKFQRRLKRSPEQVVRYSWGGAPLWMAPPPREASTSTWPPSCSRCGAPRTFELQVMPTLPFRLGAASGDGAVQQEVGWGTACVYTCSQDCPVDGPCEEFVVVQSAA